MGLNNCQWASNDGVFGLAGVLFVCALAVQKAARNKIGMRCCVFINVSIQNQPPALGCDFQRDRSGDLTGIMASVLCLYSSFVAWGSAL
jgi:hypothetical protein